MNKTQLALSVTCLVFSALAMSGCGYSKDQQDVRLKQHVRLMEVKGVRCVVFEGYRAGGLSCDWTGPPREIVKYDEASNTERYEF